MTYGERLRELRRAQGWTQREMVERVHRHGYPELDVVLLSKIEAGRMLPPADERAIALIAPFAIGREATEAARLLEEMAELALGSAPTPQLLTEGSAIACARITPEEALRREQARLDEWNRMAREEM